MPGACRGATKKAAKCGGLKAGGGLAEAHAARKQPSKGLTLELSGGGAVRLNELLYAALLADIRIFDAKEFHDDLPVFRSNASTLEVATALCREEIIAHSQIAYKLSCCIEIGSNHGDGRAR